MRPGGPGPNRVSHIRPGETLMKLEPLSLKKPATSAMRSTAPLALRSRTLPPAPTATVTRLAEVCLAARLRLLTSGTPAPLAGVG